MKLVVFLAVTLVTLNCMNLGHTNVVDEPKLPFDSNFSLRFQYAADKSAPLAASAFTVSWNGNTIATVVPTDYLLHRVFYNVTANVCQNQVSIQNSANAGNNGITVDNIQLVRVRGECGVEDVIVNGNFADAYDPATGKLNSFSSGWVSQNPPLSLALGNEVNKNWPLHNPVAYLTNGNDVYQYIYFDNNFYQVSDSQCLNAGQ